jgi:flagellar M-ring protein FliF
MSADAASLSLGSSAGSRFSPSMRPLLLLVGVAAAVAAGVSVVLWSRGPTYSMLYGNLGNEEGAQVVQALDAAAIPYKLDPSTGAITVPAERIHEARLKLAGQGLPQGDGGGFAMMSKDPGFGVSQFMEGARYQHALETELARTISSLQAIEGARVHLALPRQSAFVRDRQAPSASVFLQMKPGRRIESNQVSAIVNLVASSIPELEAKQVTVVDQQGHLLSAPRTNDDLAVTDEQFEFARRLEEVYTQRIEGLLSPIVGRGKVRAQVVADVEMSVTEETREQYRPESSVVRSEQTSEESSRAGAGSQGVPGALTNQPPQPGVALPAAVNTAVPAAAPGAKPAQPAVAAAQVAEGPDNTSKQSTRNFEIDRTISHTRQPAGRIKRMTVAVLVDNVRVTSKDGKTTDKPLVQAQLDNLSRLVKDAVGFDQARGDSVNVVNASFAAEAPEEVQGADAEPWWQLALVRDLAKLGVGAIVLLVLALGVLRPLVRGLVAQSKQLPPPAAVAIAEGSRSPPGQVAGKSYEQQISDARTLVAKDPRVVAQVVKSWVAADE